MFKAYRKPQKKHVKYGEFRYGLPLGKQQIRLDY